MKTTSLPFELDRDEIRGHQVPAYEIHGTVRLEGEEIVIEFRLERGSAEEGAHMTRVPLADVKKITRTGGVVKSPRLLIEVNRDALLKELPWADGCMCVMRFKHGDGQRLRELIEEAEVRIAKIRTRGGAR